MTKVNKLIGLTHFDDPNMFRGEVAEVLGTVDFIMQRANCTQRESDGKMEYVYHFEYKDKMYNVIATDTIEYIIKL